MKKDIIIAKQCGLQRAFFWYLVAVMAAGLLVVALSFILPDSWKEEVSCFGMSRHQVAVNVMIASIMVIVFGGVFIIGRRYDLKCPKCGRSIQGGFYSGLAITTGKCGHCGETIVEE